MTETCIQEGCDLPKGKARGYCNAHYLRLTRGQDMRPPVRRALPLKERFWQKVDKASGGCWLWSGATYSGYGCFNFGGKMRHAHRVSYELLHGDIPDGLEVDHMCHNRACVNPAHLRLATKILNGQNRGGLNRNNKSGVRGVYWAKDAGCWIAKGHLNGHAVYVGRFDDLDDAAEAIKEWRRENMPYSINDHRKEAA